MDNNLPCLFIQWLKYIFHLTGHSTDKKFNEEIFQNHSTYVLYMYKIYMCDLKFFQNPAAL